MDKPLEGIDYYIRLIDLPSYTLGGAVTPNDDGTYSVYINARLDAEHRKRACDHEIAHIIADDLHNSRTIEEIENI